MPYIKKENRINLDESLDLIKNINTKGELEYCIFKLMLRYSSNKPVNYSNLHDTTYAAMHCADEFRRRFLDERENVAMNTNGDILIKE